MNRLENPNRAALEAVARRIGEFLSDVVFVGGQVAELYITSPAAVRMRPTIDVDVVVTAGSRAEYRRIEERLSRLGFRHDTSEGAPICRWVSREGHRLDLMPVDEAILGFSNRWYPLAVELTESYALGADLVITIPRPAVFVATKLAAFRDRGSEDLLASHDLEDVITVVAGRPELVDEVQELPEDARAWMSEQIADLLGHRDFLYAVQGAVPDAAQMPEYREEVLTRFERLAQASDPG